MTHLSWHAIERARERVWPGLSRSRVRDELERLCAEAESVTSLDWHYLDDKDRVPDSYLLVADGIAVPVIDGVGVTTIVRASMGEGARQFRKHKRRKKARTKRYDAENKRARRDAREHRHRRGEAA